MVRVDMAKSSGTPPNLHGRADETANSAVPPLTVIDVGRRIMAG